MKIVYIVPGVLPQEELSRREKILKQWAAPHVEVTIDCVTEGPASIESIYEEYLSIPATAKKIFELEKQYDAAILGCAGDPGLDAMREITSEMFVVGPAESSLLSAAMLGHRFSVITIADSIIQSFYELAYKAGVSAKLASVKSINIPVLELANNPQKTLEKTVELGRQVMENDRTDVIVLGCMSMGFLNVAEALQNELQIPVINPPRIALKTAEMMVSCNLSHSNKAFPTPLKLTTGKVKSLDELMV